MMKTDTCTSTPDTAGSRQQSWMAQIRGEAARLAETDVYTHSRVNLDQGVPYTYDELFEKVTGREFNENNFSDGHHDEADILTIADAYDEAFHLAQRTLQLASANELLPH